MLEEKAGAVDGTGTVWWGGRGEAGKVSEILQRGVGVDVCSTLACSDRLSPRRQSRAWSALAQERSSNSSLCCYTLFLSALRSSLPSRSLLPSS